MRVVRFGNGDVVFWHRRRSCLWSVQFFFSKVELQVDKEDNWKWQLDRDYAYSVVGVYLHRTSLQMQHACEVSYLVWHKDVPLKVSLFVWHLL